MKALILSGGTGTRLRPLTFTNAKQLLPLANKPILFHIIEKIVKEGINKIGIIVGNTHEEVRKTVGNGERWNVEITYIYQPLPLGLAHAVKIASDFIDGEEFLMILGDNVFNMSLTTLIDNFHTSNASSSILLLKVENPSQYGVAVVDNDRIIKLVEKPKEFISDLIITGVYIFDKNIFTAIDKIRPSDRGELEITDAIQKLLDMGGKVTYELLRGWWKDTGKLQDMLEANRSILDETEYCETALCSDNSLLQGKMQISKGVIIKDSTVIGPCAVDSGATIIGSHIGPYSSIGRDVFIKNCRIANSIILENTHLENLHCRVNDSLIGKNVSIKAIDKQEDSNSFLLGDYSELYL